MADLPPDHTPLYHHPLPALEAWLRQLGAIQRRRDLSRWDLHHSDWSAEIELDVEELTVRWQREGRPVVRHFSYGLGRRDVEAAILAGP